MTRDDIYDHLAQVYLGKRRQASSKKEPKWQFNAWLFINFLIIGIIFASTFYGLSAFLTREKAQLQKNIIYTLQQGLLQIPYDFRGEDASPQKTFSLSVDDVNVSKYGRLHFSIRAREEGTPGVVKVMVKNRRNETASFYVKDVGLKWKELSIPFEHFRGITDWDSLTEITFVFESWNVKDARGVVLIDGLYLQNAG